MSIRDASRELAFQMGDGFAKGPKYEPLTRQLIGCAFGPELVAKVEATIDALNTAASSDPELERLADFWAGVFDQLNA